MFKFYILLMLTLIDLYSFELENLIQLPENQPVLVVEKSTHLLHIYQKINQKHQVVKTFQIASGKVIGDKQISGDKKTPEGIYFFNQFLSKEELFRQYGQEARIYGAGAFTMNYPNPIDRFYNKTGHGIWLHSTDDDLRVDKGLDSRGCVVAKNLDLKEISKYISLQDTPILIVHEIKFLQDKAFDQKQKKLQTIFENWHKSWQEQNSSKYLSFYSKKDYKDKKRKSYKAFSSFKKSLFAKKKNIWVDFSKVMILTHKNFAIVRAIQKYKSSTISDTGIKTLYLKLNETYQWKIINESWQKLSSSNNIFFAKEAS